MTDLFLAASRKAFRYDSPIGQLNTEQLWDLPLLTTRSNQPSLNDCAVRLSRAIAEQGELSFVENRANPAKTELETKLEVVKFVIATKQAENAAATERKAREAQRSKIDEIIASKKDEALSSMSLEELEALKNSL